MLNYAQGAFGYYILSFEILKKINDFELSSSVGEITNLNDLKFLKVSVDFFCHDQVVCRWDHSHKSNFEEIVNPPHEFRLDLCPISDHSIYSMIPFIFRMHGIYQDVSRPTENKSPYTRSKHFAKEYMYIKVECT